MRRTQQPVQVYERKGADGMVTFYHHITIHGNRERVRLAALGRHRYNSRSYLLAKKSAEQAAMVKSADIFRGDYGVIENRGGIKFIDLVIDHCAGKAREGVAFSVRLQTDRRQRQTQRRAHPSNAHHWAWITPTTA